MDAAPETLQGRRAASLLRTLGALELLTLGPALATCLLVLQSEPFQRHLEAGLTPQGWAWAQQAAPLATPLIALLGVAPALAYLALAGPVRRRHKGAVLAVQFLLLLQLLETFMLGYQLLPLAAQSFHDGQPVHVTVLVLMVGTPLLAMGYTFWKLGGLSAPAGEVPR